MKSVGSEDRTREKAADRARASQPPTDRQLKTEYATPARNPAVDTVRTHVPVTVDNFARAESDMYFGNLVRLGGLATFHHHRRLMPIERQEVVRSNRDTLYS